MLKISKSKIKISLLVFFLALSPSMEHSATADPAQDLSVISALTLNLARFTQWPSDASKIQLCVFGDNVIQEAFEKINDMEVGKKKLAIIHLMRIKNVNQCQLIFINGLDRSTVLQLVSDLKNSPILTVGIDDSHFVDDGGMVVFKIVEGKVNLEINLQAVKLAGLEINSRVLKLATIINP